MTETGADIRGGCLCGAVRFRSTAAPLATRHGVMSASVRTRPVPPPMAQLSPSDRRKAMASDSPPSR